METLKKACEICLKLTMKTPERTFFIVNFGHISLLFSIFLLLTCCLKEHTAQLLTDVLKS